MKTSKITQLLWKIGKFISSEKLSISIKVTRLIEDAMSEQERIATIDLCMDVGSGGGGAWPPWIFIHVTDKVEGNLMVLFFGLVFFVALSLWKLFCQRPWIYDFANSLI